jgi:hypothetical protein
MVLLVESLPVDHPLALNHGLMRVFTRFLTLLAPLIQLILVFVQAFIHVVYFLVLCEPILLSEVFGVELVLLLRFVTLDLRVLPEVCRARLLHFELETLLNLSLRLDLREFEGATEVGGLILGLQGIPFLTTRGWVVVHHRQRRLVVED